MEENMQRVRQPIKSRTSEICPVGKHDVRTHLEHIPPSKKHPSGLIITRHEHCANNPLKKETLSFSEIKKITKDQFSNLTDPPTPGVLTKFKNADK